PRRERGDRIASGGAAAPAVPPRGSIGPADPGSTGGSGGGDGPPARRGPRLLQLPRGRRRRRRRSFSRGPGGGGGWRSGAPGTGLGGGRPPRSAAAGPGHGLRRDQGIARQRSQARLAGERHGQGSDDL